MEPNEHVDEQPVVEHHVGFLGLTGSSGNQPAEEH